MHKLTIKDHADLRNDDVLLSEQTEAEFDPITWKRFNPDHVGGLDPGIRHYPPEPLGSHKSDSQPCPPYWAPSGIDRVNSEFSKVVLGIIAIMLGLFGLAVMFVGFGGLNLVERLRGLL